MSVMEVKRNNPSTTRRVESPVPAIGPGQVALAVDKFALTANNVTYAIAGDQMRYWDFFPIDSDDGKQWGRVPVWGFADVQESRVDGLEVGARVYGYFPMASYLIVEPVKLSPAGFMDGSQHRAHLSTVYNHYTLCAADPGYAKDQEDRIMLFRPLFTTSFLIDDFLADNDFFGGRQVIISSASSKTAMGTAWIMAKNKPDTRQHIVGLTSAGNKAFVESLGIYDQVVDYDEIESLHNEAPTCYVDIAGSASVRSAVHHHFEDQLKYSCAIGASHWSEFAPGGILPGPKPIMFFAPDQVSKRTKDWGLDGFQMKVAKAWTGYMATIGEWLKIRHVSRDSGLEDAWLDVIAGKAAPSTGIIVTK